MEKRKVYRILNARLCSKCTRYDECPIDYRCMFYDTVVNIIENLDSDYSMFGVEKA